jgi:hypothetical protein
MAYISEYTSASILESIRKTLALFNESGKFTGNPEKSAHIQKKIVEFQPLLLTPEQAENYLLNAENIALGERVCRALHPGSPHTLSIFLDDLALAMVSSGHAKRSDREKALMTLKNNSMYPIIISRVSGKYQEICTSIPSECVFWLAEKNGMKCLKRQD